MSNFTMESEIPSKIRNIELRRLGRRFFNYKKMRMILKKKKVAKGCEIAYANLLRNQVIINIRRKYSLCGICSVLTFFHPLR